MKRFSITVCTWFSLHSILNQLPYHHLTELLWSHKMCFCTINLHHHHRPQGKCPIQFWSFPFSWTSLHSKVESKRNNSKAPPSFRLFWTGNMSQKCLLLWTYCRFQLTLWCWPQLVVMTDSLALRMLLASVADTRHLHNLLLAFHCCYSQLTSQLCRTALL